MALVLTLEGICFGITAEIVAAKLEHKDRFTLIDIRRGVYFEQGHIPGAINIPVRLCRDIQLPPLGDVIVYGDGFDRQPARDAVAILNEKPGLSAESMTGGLSRWEALGYPTTKPYGFSREKLSFVTYQKLTAMARSNPDLVLVDLRQSEDGKSIARTPQSDTGEASGSPDLTDLAEVFPGVRVASLPFAGFGNVSRGSLSTAAALKQMDRNHADVYVLIDNGNTLAKETARKLMAAGIRRFVILTGGEESLVREGRSGLMIKQE